MDPVITTCIVLVVGIVFVMLVLSVRNTSKLVHAPKPPATTVTQPKITNYYTKMVLSSIEEYGKPATYEEWLCDVNMRAKLTGIKNGYSDFQDSIETLVVSGSVVLLPGIKKYRSTTVASKAATIIGLIKEIGREVNCSVDTELYRDGLPKGNNKLSEDEQAQEHYLYFRNKRAKKAKQRADFLTKNNLRQGDVFEIIPD